MKVKKGDTVVCIKENGGGVRVGDVGKVLSTPKRGIYAKCYFPSMSKVCISIGYWVGSDDHIAKIPEDTEDLFY